MLIDTERLLLRELDDADWPAVLAYQSDPLYLRYYEWKERSPDDVQEFVRMLAALQHQQPRITFQLGIVLASSGQLIGNCGIRLDSAGAHEADIGYELAPEHWGSGYATEAARAILEFGFSDLHLHRIWAWCVADNVGSARVLEKIGMRAEGRLREKDHYKGRWWDRLLFAVLDYEWGERRTPAPGRGTAAAEPASDLTLICYSDGASRGNPGPASIGGVVLRPDGAIVEEISEAIGRATSNVAEWRAAAAVLEAAIRHGARSVELRMDSELVVRQLTGRYQVKSAALIPLHERVQQLRRSFVRFTAVHVPRARNSRADALANAALDRGSEGIGTRE